MPCFRYNKVVMKKQMMMFLAVLLLAGCEGSLIPAPINSVTSDDKFGPYINIRMFEYTTTVGNPVDFSNVTGYDDVDGLMPVEVIGKIDYSQPGDYTQILSCRDTSGNETQVEVKIHVAEIYQASEEPAPETDEKQLPETTCSKWNAKDHERACGAVLSEDIEQYDLLYQGEEWHQICINAAAETGSCEAVHTNDGSFWGYGVIRHVEEETEEEG